VGKTTWRPERVSVENGSEELGVEVKCLSNPEIAGSPRKVLRYRLGRSLREVEHGMGKGPSPVTESNPTPKALRGVRE
jgi:hypothetical protein